MKVELHLHTTRYSECARNTPQEIMWLMVAAGYQAVYITEHDAVWADDEIEDLRRDLPSLLIFPGVELSLGNDRMEHLLVLGANDPAYLSMRDPAEIIAKAREEEHLTVLAHPFRWEQSHRMLDDETLPDAMEYHSGNQEGRSAEEARGRADVLGLPLINTGDVHGLDFVNRYWIETDHPIEQADDIRRIVLSGAYTNCRRDEK